MDLACTASGMLVGLIVGLTGVGGGAPGWHGSRTHYPARADGWRWASLVLMTWRSVWQVRF